MMEKGTGQRGEGLLAALPSLLLGSAEGVLPPSLSVLPPGAQILFLEQSDGNPWDFRQESWSNPAECHPQKAGHLEETGAPGVCRPPHPGQGTAATSRPGLHLER